MTKAKPRAEAGTFTCGHCAAFVPLPARAPREVANSCPECHWSRHVTFGLDSLPPCGAMMRPRLIGNDRVTWRCTGCGFMLTGPTEAGVDALWAAVSFAARPGSYLRGSVTIHGVSVDDPVTVMDEADGMAARFGLDGE
jgi:RNHCP domain